MRIAGRWRALGAAAALTPLLGCVSTPPHAALAAPAPVFSPLAFFQGSTAGEGVLRVAMSRPRAVHVAGEGRQGPDGGLVLVQRVDVAGREPRTRTWRLLPGPDGDLAVTLSDAAGPVAAHVRGNLLHVRFAMRGRLAVEQWIYVQPDGRSALNRMVVRKFGVPVASLRETTRRVG